MIQVYQGRNLETIDLKRTARSGAAGFIGHGPLCHFWMSFMENYLDFGGAWWGTGVKVGRMQWHLYTLASPAIAMFFLSLFSFFRLRTASITLDFVLFSCFNARVFQVLADQTVWSLYLNAVYSGLIGILAGRPLPEVRRDVQATSWPALRTSWRFWPFVHAVSFSHAIPLDLKLLWVDAVEVVWVTLLSKVANDDREALGNSGVGQSKEPQQSGQAPMCVVDNDVADPATEVRRNPRHSDNIVPYHTRTNERIQNVLYVPCFAFLFSVCISSPFFEVAI